MGSVDMENIMLNYDTLLEFLLALNLGFGWLVLKNKVKGCENS
jgi:hypothetical protein